MYSNIATVKTQHYGKHLWFSFFIVKLHMLCSYRWVIYIDKKNVRCDRYDLVMSDGWHFYVSAIKKFSICGHLDIERRIKVTVEQRQNVNVFLCVITTIVFKSKAAFFDFLLIYSICKEKYPDHKNTVQWIFTSDHTHLTTMQNKKKNITRTPKAPLVSPPGDAPHTCILGIDFKWHWNTPKC